MPTKKTFTVTCTETTTYEFPVTAANEDEALNLAKKVLLGDDTGIGAIRFAWPDDKTLSIDVNDRDWEVAMSDADGSDDAIDQYIIDEFVAPYPMDANLLVTESYIRNRLGEHFECEDVDAFLLDNENDEGDEVMDRVQERQAALIDRIVFAMRKKGALKKKIAEALWDGSEESAMVQDIIDNCVMDFTHDFTDEHGYLK